MADNIIVNVDEAALGRLKDMPEARATLKRCADRAEAFQVATCPVDTGHLVGAIGQRDNADGSIDIGVVKYPVEYDLHVELGHQTTAGTWVPAQPYIRPSIDAAKKGLSNG